MKNILTVLFFFIGIVNSFAQNGVRIAAATGTADASAMLDVVSTTKGFLVPRMNLTGPALTNPAPVTSPATGLLVYNLGGGGIAATGFYYWNGTQWVQLSAGALSGAGTTNYVAKWTSASAIGNSQIYDNGTNLGIGTTTPNAKFEMQGGNFRLNNAGDSKYEFFGSGLGNDRGFVGWQSTSPVGVYLWNRDNTPIYFGTTNAERARIDAAGNMGIGTTAPTNKLQVAGEVVRTNTRVSNAERYPLAHSSNGSNLMMIDPSWSNAELQAYFNNPSGTTVQWFNDPTAPAGYCIQIDGYVPVGGEYNSGFPYIPVEADATYYMECWIRSTSGTHRHYMGSNEYNESFVSLGGNPGSFGYWVMSNTLTDGTWKKVSGYISGFHASTVGKFEPGTKYWTPMALFNFSSGGTCFISGWTVTKISGGQNSPRRDYRPYGTPTYVWDGAVTACASGSPVSARGSTGIGVGANYCTNKWPDAQGKWMFTLTSLSTEVQNPGATLPTNGLYLDLPASEGVHNTLLVSTIDGDRWSVWSAFVCNSAGTSCTKLMRSVNNANSSGGSSSTYTLGPYNQMKETAYHAWLAFPVNKDLVSQYISGGNLRFLLTSGVNNSNGGTLYMSGYACVPNPNGFVQNPPLALHWGLNGNASSETTWYGQWNNDGMVYVNAGSTHTISVKIMDPTRDVLVTIHEHDGGWYGGSPYITVGSDGTVFRPTRGIQSISQQMYDNMSFKGSMSFVIPASIVAAQVVTTSSGVPNVLRLTINNTRSNNHYYIRGIDTEIY